MKLHTEVVEHNIKLIHKVIVMYEWLLDLYVLDFFVENHWEKLPNSWRRSFEKLDPQHLGDILTGGPANQVLPLSFLSLIKSINILSIPRKLVSEENKKLLDTKSGSICLANHPKLKNLFLKHVKLKKRHEISVMAEVVNNVATKSGCKAVVDFGSGLGHLVRALSYKNELYTAGIECQKQLTEEARKLDLELEYTASKHVSKDQMAQLHQPIHFNVTLKSHTQLLQLPLPDTMTTYGLVGLHPCGDLGPLLLKHFIDCDNVKFICLVGCCYMKLTCDGDNCGYPMSRYVQELGSRLSFVSREIACHAIEVYCERLKQGKYEDLKIHSYRAALERILVEYDPKLRHAPVRSIKHSSNMTFKKYCSLALSRVDKSKPEIKDAGGPSDAKRRDVTRRDVPQLDIRQVDISRGEEDLRAWRRVVTVYTLRLALAPLVESLILLDRALYIMEKGLLHGPPKRAAKQPPSWGARAKVKKRTVLRDISGFRP